MMMKCRIKGMKKIDKLRGLGFKNMEVEDVDVHENVH
jgi:hypothetical protein